MLKYKYKSFKTYENIKNSWVTLQKNIELDYQSKDEIDSKFNEFGEKFKNKYLQDNQVKFDPKTRNKTDQGHVKSLDMGENLSGLVDKEFKNQLQKNMKSNSVNPVVQMFGNALIATVFQSLIIKTIEKNFNMKINISNDVDVSSSILKAFDISTIVLSSLKTQEEKQDYILSCMDRMMTNLLKNWKDKIDQKEQRQIQQEKVDSIRKTKEKQAEDIYYWLNIKTKYDALQKKLRQQIVEKLNDYENLVKVAAAMDEKKNLYKTKQYTAASNLKVDIENINYTSTKDIFMNMNSYGNPQVQQFLSRLGLTKDKDKQLDKKANNASLNISTQDLNNSVNNQEKTISKEQLSANNQQILSTMASTRSSSDQQLWWNKQREQDFVKSRQKAQNYYSNEVTSSSWNNMGFLPFVQAYYKEMKKSMQRDYLLDKYQSGGWLTEEEVKFLVNTSELLNSCIDKKFIQNAVNIINLEILDNMELGLAEEILKNYEEIQIKIKQSRQEFINTKLEKTQIDNYNFQMKQIRERAIKTNFEFQKKYIKMMTNICQKMEREGKFNEQVPNDVRGAKILKQYMQGKIGEDDLILKIKSSDYYYRSEEDEQNFKKQVKLEEFKKMNEQKKQEYLKLISKPKGTETNDFKTKIKRHSYHPSSKIILSQEMKQAHINEESEQQQANLELLMAKKENNHQQAELFKLEIKSNCQLKDKNKFHKFYTGGPVNVMREDPFYINPAYPELSCTKRELELIIFIQKHFRAHYYNKKLKKLIESKRQETKYEYQYKIGQIRQYNELKVQKGENQQIRDIKVINLNQQRFKSPRSPRSPRSPISHENQKFQQPQNFQQFQQQPQQQQQNHFLPKKKNNSQYKKLSLLNFFSNAINQKTSEIDHRTNQLIQLKNGEVQPEDLMPQTTQSAAGSNFVKIMRSPSQNIKEDSYQIGRPNTAKNLHTQYSFNKLNPGQALHTRTTTNMTVGQSTQLSTEQNEDFTKKFMMDDDDKFNRYAVGIKILKLFEAARKNKFWIVQTTGFVYSARDINQKDSQKSTALHYAVQNENIDFIQWLLDCGADVNIHDGNGNTSLHLAFKQGRYDIIQLLMNQDGDLNAINFKGDTPLAMGSIKILKQLNLTDGIAKINQYTLGDHTYDNNQLFFNKSIQVNKTNYSSQMNNNSSHVINSSKQQHNVSQFKKNNLELNEQSQSGLLKRNPTNDNNQNILDDKPKKISKNNR